MAGGTLQQQMLSQFFAIINASKLASELTEQTQINALTQYLNIQQGANDAQKIKIPLVRGILGTYNATTNTPALSNATGIEGDSYKVTVAGTQDFGAGSISMNIGDVIEFRDSLWGVRATTFVVSDTKILGDVGALAIEAFINANDSVDWNMASNTMNIYTMFQNGYRLVYLYVGTLPKYLGLSHSSAVSTDFELISSGTIVIDGYNVIKGTGNDSETAIEVGDFFEGWATATRYVRGKMIASPFDVNDETKVSLVIDNSIF